MIDIEQQADGRWLAEVPELPGIMAYGPTRERAVAAAEALTLRVLAQRIDHGEAVPQIPFLFSIAA